MLVFGNGTYAEPSPSTPVTTTVGVPIERCSCSPHAARPVIDLTHERIKRRPVLGGLINQYERAA